MSLGQVVLPSFELRKEEIAKNKIHSLTVHSSKNYIKTGAKHEEVNEYQFDTSGNNYFTNSTYRYLPDSANVRVSHTIYDSLGNVIKHYYQGKETDSFIFIYKHYPSGEILERTQIRYGQDLQTSTNRIINLYRSKKNNFRFYSNLLKGKSGFTLF